MYVTQSREWWTDNVGDSDEMIQWETLGMANTLLLEAASMYKAKHETGVTEHKIQLRIEVNVNFVWKCNEQ